MRKVKAKHELKDSGERRQFPTGAVRDTGGNKPAFHLMSYFGLRAPAMQMERGARKYSARNWEKGMPLSVFLRSATDHLAKLAAGFDDEPHLDAALWNLHCLAEGRFRIAAGLWPQELDDLPRTYAGLHPEDLIRAVEESKRSGDGRVNVPRIRRRVRS